MTIGGRITIFLVIILIIGGIIYFQFMNDKTQTGDEIISQEISGDVVLKTNLGDIELELFDTEAPKTVGNFKKLVGEGFYDGIKFHRVKKGFMIQGGDPLTKDDSQKVSWGMGGPGYAFEDEIYTGNSNVMGSIAMANSGPNTNGSQFFINTADNGFLDQKHTVFGKVVSGMEIVTQIENTPVGERDIPIEAIIIESAILVD